MIHQTTLRDRHRTTTEINLSSGEKKKQKEQKVQLKRAQHLNEDYFIMRHKQKKKNYEDAEVPDDP